MDVHTLDTVLLVGALVVVAAVAAVRLSVAFGLPSLVLYLLIGLALGESGLGVQFSDAGLAQALGYAALIVILTEGGLTTSWAEVRPSFPVGIALATAGVAVSTAVVAVIGRFVLGLDWTLAVLLGAVFAPTDAAAVFSTLRRVPLRRRLSGALETESGLNDAPTVVLVTLISAQGFSGGSAAELAGTVAFELVVGSVVGLVVGRGGAEILRRTALPSSGLYPLVVMTLAVLGYSSSAAIHASGFAAVYVCALVLGNSGLPHRMATRSFAEGLAWVSQIGLFVMLGLLASPSDMPRAFVPALVAGIGLTLVARPIAVWLCTLPFRFSIPERIFLSWAGLRGAIPVILATIPLAQGVPDSEWLFAVVFVVAVVFTLLQAPTLPALATRLGVAAPAEARDAEVESAPLERIEADLIQVRVPDGSRLHGVTVVELRLPPGVAVSLLVRDGSPMVPHDGTQLRHGDEILIVAPRALRRSTERRLRAVGRRGRLAGWFGEDGAGEDGAGDDRASDDRPGHEGGAGAGKD